MLLSHPSFLPTISISSPIFVPLSISAHLGEREERERERERETENGKTEEGRKKKMMLQHYKVYSLRRKVISDASWTVFA